MGSSRFEPARIFPRRRDFGRVADAVPDLPFDLSVDYLAWAYYQHQVALVVLGEIEGRPDRVTAQAELATRLGEDRDWLMRKLYGRATASLVEMIKWLIKLGYEAPSLEYAIRVAHYVDPFHFEEVTFVDAATLSPEEFERARAQQLESVAHLMEMEDEEEPS